MKRFIGLIGVMTVFILSGCLDTTEETTMNDDGSGSIVSTIDMGKMITLLSSMGAGDEKMKDVEKLKMDSVIYFRDIKDSLGKLSDSEKKLLEKGSARLIMNFKEEKFSVAFSVPFSKPSDILAVNDVLKKTKGKMMEKIMSKVMESEENKGDDEMEMMGNKESSGPDINNYFNFTFDKNKLTKTINKEQMAKVEDDKSLKSLQEMSQMGMPVNFKTIINLPRAAKKAEGKGVTLSGDKKKVTIEGTLDDFLEDASRFEYVIEF